MKLLRCSAAIAAAALALPSLRPCRADDDVRRVLEEERRGAAAPAPDDPRLPAAAALACRPSVAAFVVNATDVRDECHGLRTAFDRACGAVSPRTALLKGTARRRLNGRHHHRRTQRTNEEVVFTEESSLNIPTADEHPSEEMLNDALLLQESNAKAATPNAAESISAESWQTVEDAAKSAEALHATFEEVVRHNLHNPESVEARACCSSILSVYHEHCDARSVPLAEEYSDQRLLAIVLVIGLCGLLKTLIRHWGVRWLPEAGGCILVGALAYFIQQAYFPHVRMSFDEGVFLRILVPPIVFEAAVKIDKRSFRRHALPICLFAVVGTPASAALTALILHTGSERLGYGVPARESLVFGALISSIDPVATLSVLNRLGMTDADAVYVLIFGESLLNDGVAIVLFQTLVRLLDANLAIDGEVAREAVEHFAVVAVGSVAAGIVAGACATVYFAAMRRCQTPMVEVVMFCCWSFVPYYVCGMLEWSGIVSILSNGFVMDMYVIGQKHHSQPRGEETDADDEKAPDVQEICTSVGFGRLKTAQNRQKLRRRIFSGQGHLSPEAESHIHFVLEIFAMLMETAIFAYLGLFLFSPMYHWNERLVFLSIFATVMGRVLMIPLFSQIVNVLRWTGFACRRLRRSEASAPGDDVGAATPLDVRTQLALVVAGLRGAMSFALVEDVPLFDPATGRGSRFKPELKAMTSASILFTVFVMGGATSYLMERLGRAAAKPEQSPDAWHLRCLGASAQANPSRDETGDGAQSKTQ